MDWLLPARTPGRPATHCWCSLFCVPRLPQAWSILSGFPSPLSCLCLAPLYLPSQLRELFTSWGWCTLYLLCCWLSQDLPLCPQSPFHAPFCKQFTQLITCLFCSVPTVSFLQEGGCALFIFEPLRQEEVCYGGEEAVLGSNSTYICVLWVIGYPFLAALQ